jgi:hypothetical protein
MSGIVDEAGVSVERSLLLWCMRAWHGGDDAAIAQKAIDEVFGRLGVADSAGAFQLFLQIVCGKAWRGVALRDLSRRSVSEDEIVLLDIIALTQGGRTMEGISLLRGLVLAEDAQSALHQAGLVGAALAGQGWFLDAPEPAIRHCAMIGAQMRWLEIAPGQDSRRP